MQQPIWHPLLAAVEGPPGTWRMVDATGLHYGTIELRRVRAGDELRYRAAFGSDLIGWAADLRTACERVHRAFVDSHGPRVEAAYTHYETRQAS